MQRDRVCLFIVCGLGVGYGASSARADDRRLVFSDEARVTPPGLVEFEHWTTWQTHTKDESDFNQFNFREELEFGINKSTQIGVEVPAWHITTGPDDEKDGPRFDHVAVDVRHIFLDPVSEDLGVGAKVEVGASEEEVFVEGKLILQKNWDKTELVYNAFAEAAWETTDEGRYEEANGEVGQSLGVSYEAQERLFVGAELLHEVPLPSWDSGEDQNLFVGPNLSYHGSPFSEKGDNWAVTVAPLFLVTGGDEEPRLQLRFVFEIEF